MSERAAFVENTKWYVLDFTLKRMLTTPTDSTDRKTIEDSTTSNWNQGTKHAIQKTIEMMRRRQKE